MELSEIERKISHNEMSAAQVFTQMKQHINCGNELKRLLTVKKPRIESAGNYPSAVELIRCGIGSNYGGAYYELAIEQVLEPIKTLLK